MYPLRKGTSDLYRSLLGLCKIRAGRRQDQSWWFHSQRLSLLPGACCFAVEKHVLKCVTLNDDAALVGVSPFDVFSLTLVSAFILKANILDLQEGLAADPLGGLGAIQLPPLDPRNRAMGK